MGYQTVWFVGICMMVVNYMLDGKQREEEEKAAKDLKIEQLDNNILEILKLREKNALLENELKELKG